jgi:hypothetical protein
VPPNYYVIITKSKAVSIISLCIFASIIRHAKCASSQTHTVENINYLIHNFILITRQAFFFFFAHHTVLYLLWAMWLYRIFFVLNLVNGALFEENSFPISLDFLYFCLKLLSLMRIQRHITHVPRSSRKVPDTFCSIFTKLEFSPQILINIPQYNIWIKSNYYEPCCSMQTDGRS